MKENFFKHFSILLTITTLFLVTISQSSLAINDYYADITIDLNDRGETSISGITNHPELLGMHHDLTTKSGKYWVFNLTSDEFSSALFRINLPKDAIINYIKSSAQISIGSDGAPFVKGILRNKPLEITMQYQFEDSSTKKSFPTLLIIGIVLLIIGLYLLIFVGKNKKYDDSKNILLTPRQQEIFSLLKKKDNVTQRHIEKTLNLPKSSISRNIASMERKGIVTKVNKGNSNVLFLTKNKK